MCVTLKEKLSIGVALCQEIAFLRPVLRFKNPDTSHGPLPQKRIVFLTESYSSHSYYPETQNCPDSGSAWDTLGSSPSVLVS